MGRRVKGSGERGGSSGREEEERLGESDGKKIESGKCWGEESMMKTDRQTNQSAKLSSERTSVLTST